jgi:arginine decarboxylase
MKFVIIRAKKGLGFLLVLSINICYTFSAYGLGSARLLKEEFALAMDQNQTPLFTALREHASKQPVQFHIPGHKKGNGMDDEFSEFIGDNALSIDLINIAPLDDLHSPHGIIRDAQMLAAEAFGADYTFFSVQGTSGAIQAMIMSVCNPGDKIIVPRNVHKSVMTGIILAGARPVFISPQMDERLGIAHGISTSSVQKALDRHKDAKAVLVINPTYFGVCTNLTEIVELAHSRNVPVLVDEAHGVHIHFHEKLPVSAMQAGADMAATSVHKLGGSLTQSSVLNVQGPRVDPKHVQAILSMLTTTSTSYLLLASLDVTRKNLALYGHERAEHAIKLANDARATINSIPGLYCFGDEILGSEAVYSHDPTKLCVHVSELGVNGFEVENWLRENHNIEVEMSDMYNFLCLITAGDTEETVGVLINALQELAALHTDREGVKMVEVHNPRIPQLMLSPREAFYSHTEVIPIEESIDRIIAEFVMVYPPGIPILLPGEVITQENIDYINERLAVGLPVQGPEDKTIKTIKVIVEESAIS